MRGGLSPKNPPLILAAGIVPLLWIEHIVLHDFNTLNYGKNFRIHEDSVRCRV